ncbi:hypothetical protein HanRHA438_Chr15g0722511 [Helianthus annuus]|nr:hypothetical protein HanRHA438_Chr15g0722511 [Helianthus annuus]
MPHPKNVTLLPYTMLQTDPHHDHLWLPLFYVIMTPTVSGSIAKAMGRKDYPLALLFTSVFVGFFLLQFYLYLSKTEKPVQKLWVNLNMWFLLTLLPFGSIYQLADFFPPQFTFTMYTLVLFCSLFMFYLFVIDDLLKCWMIWRLPENQSSDAAGELDYNSVSIWVKV